MEDFMYTPVHVCGLGNEATHNYKLWLYSNVAMPDSPPRDKRDSTWQRVWSGLCYSMKSATRAMKYCHAIVEMIHAHFTPFFIITCTYDIESYTVLWNGPWYKAIISVVLTCIVDEISLAKPAVRGAS